MKVTPLLYLPLFIILFLSSFTGDNQQQWIRINRLGYTPAGVKVAIWCSKEVDTFRQFELVDSATQKVVFSADAGKDFGAYGPFSHTHRLNFSAVTQPGTYYLKAGKATSPNFKIGTDVYKGAADFALFYMRQQRCGFNPFLKDSCHTNDGYTLYAPVPDSTYIDATGGWHDASDYLQYSTTSANATYHLLAAYRDFPTVFGDTKAANGLDGKNGKADVLDEAKWGLDWMLKMHPKKDWMFNQIADDRDHISMRIPKEDSQYGRGYQRPVYFINGLPQQRGKFLNDSKGTSSTAAKFASAFALGSQLFNDKQYQKLLTKKAKTAYAYAHIKPGVAQTASVKAPYIYEEDNWVDDMTLAAAALHKAMPSANTLTAAFKYAKQEPVTPWMKSDTARHYQWYPFINVGLYELAKQAGGTIRDTVTGFYKAGIDAVWKRAQQNAFYRGVPFVWCSNNLTTSFAIQCYWYKQLTGDQQYDELEQANIDWLFGANPWGTSMVYGLPTWGDTPVDPHSAFTHLGKYPINGGLVDGPVYTSIYKSLIGIKLYAPDEYEAFQSDLAVYHDDYGDYSTNEPTMDGTASLIYLLAVKEHEAQREPTKLKGGVIKGNQEKKKIALVFAGGDFADGGEHILQVLKKHQSKGSFFFTGSFYRNPSFNGLIKKLVKDNHYLGPHSDEHLLYCDWNNRDSLLVTKEEFTNDLVKNIKSIKPFGIQPGKIKYFIPPYEWYNDSISKWSQQMGIQLINFSPGTRSTADYTYPGLTNYRSSDEIYQSIIKKEREDPIGLNGFILLVHIGTDPRRTDKFYLKLDPLIKQLKAKGYSFVSLDEVMQD